MSTIQNLLPDLVYTILHQLELADISSFAKTCSQLNTLSKDETIWKKMVEHTILVQNTSDTFRKLEIKQIESDKYIPRSKFQPIRFQSTWLSTFQHISRKVWILHFRYDKSYHCQVFNSKSDAIRFVWLKYFKSDQMLDGLYPGHISPKVLKLDEEFSVSEIKELVLKSESDQQFLEGVLISHKIVYETCKEFLSIRNQYKTRILKSLNENNCVEGEQVEVSLTQSQIF